jgi:ABC-2 type transport system permease protein
VSGLSGPGGRDGSADFDLARPGRTGSGQVFRSFRTAVALGWKMEANWTDPLLFFIYSVAKPVASALMLVFMLEVIAGPAGRANRGFVVVGSALWSFVVGGLAGLAWSVLDDRERYRMLKYIYVSPSDFLVVLMGRGVARLAVGGMGALITLALGVVVLGIPFDPFRIDWPLLAAVMALGLAAIMAVSILLAAVCLQTRQDSWQYPEAVAGALFLVTGAVFPLAVLPSAVQFVGLLVPFTWWIEGVRRALFPTGLSAIGGAGSTWASLVGPSVPSGTSIVFALLLTGGIATLGSMVIFRASERRAKERGLIDQTTGS